MSDDAVTPETNMNDPVIDAIADVIQDYDPHMDSLYETASAALRAALAVKAKCPTCKGTGDVSPAEYVTEKWTCRDCGGSGEAPLPLDEAVELLREWRFQWDNTCCFPDAATDAFLARLRVEVTPKEGT